METPNPHCVKFMPGKEVMGSKGCREYKDMNAVHDSPLAKLLLRLEDVQKLLYGSDFISVTKKESAQWEVLLILTYRHSSPR